MPGFPIRTSSDQRSVDSSPRLIAASYVLHRLPVPRHPPCALKHLQHKKPIIRRKIAHQFVRNNAPPNLKGRQPHSYELDARNHYPQIKHHTPPPKFGGGVIGLIIRGVWLRARCVNVFFLQRLWGVVSFRPVSASSLHLLLGFQVWSINPVVCGGPYPS